jgi:hypothetical protein
MQDWLNVQRFNQGDRVRVIGPGAETYPGATGVVSSIKSVGSVYRYAVEFQDGHTETFFGFELRHEGPRSS